MAEDDKPKSASWLRRRAIERRVPPPTPPLPPWPPLPDYAADLRRFREDDPGSIPSFDDLRSLADSIEQGEQPSEKKAVSDPHSADTLTGRVLDYMGMGFLLVPPEIFVLEVVLASGPVNYTLILASFLGCYAVGIALLALGINWKRIKPSLSVGFANSISKAANSPFIWFLILALFAFGPPVLVGVLSSTAASKTSAPISSTANPGEPIYVKNIRFSWDSLHPLDMSAEVTMTGDRLRVYLQEYWVDPIASGGPSNPAPPILLDEFNNLVEGQLINSQIISLSSWPVAKLMFGHTPGQFIIPEPSMHLIRVFFLFGGSAKQQNYKFAVRVNQSRTDSVMVLRADTLDEIAKWVRQ